jgi:hypothetical protein
MVDQSFAKNNFLPLSRVIGNRHYRGSTGKVDTSAEGAVLPCNLIQRQPDDFAGDVAAIAVSRLGKGVGQLPLLPLVAPLHRRI